MAINMACIGEPGRSDHFLGAVELGLGFADLPGVGNSRFERSSPDDPLIDAVRRAKPPTLKYIDNSNPARRRAIMRFEVSSAFVIGGLVPILGTWLEYCRRGFSLSLIELAGNLDDYLAGAILLIAGWLSIRTKPFAPVYLVAAWAYCTSLMVK
jgi:hypothetical protein